MSYYLIFTDIDVITSCDYSCDLSEMYKYYY